MSVQFGRLCSVIIRETFGDIAAEVTTELLHRGSRPLSQLGQSIPTEKVKEALVVLIQHNLVTFTDTGKNQAEYEFELQNVLPLLRFPKYLFLIKTIYGEEGEALVEEVLHAGQITLSNLLYSAVASLRETNQNEDAVSVTIVKEKFTIIASKKYLEKCSSLAIDLTDKPSAVPSFSPSSDSPIFVPEVNVALIHDCLVNKQPLPPGQPDDGIFWKINPERFHQDFRDKLMIRAAERRLDKSAGQLMQLFLEVGAVKGHPWDAVYNPVSMNGIRDVIKRCSYHHLNQYLEDYVKALEEDQEEFLDKCGDASGGEYRVTMEKFFVNLTWCLLENLVQERFGSRAHRIFRLIRVKKYLEQEQIQELAMIPGKEAKLLTYKLMDKNFIQLREIRRGSAVGPAKVLYLFYINLNQLVRMVLELCYKGIHNAISRRTCETNEHSILLDKQQRVASIIQSSKDQGATEELISEIEDLLTLPERAAIDKVTKMTEKFQQAELQTDHSIFILQMYLHYCSSDDDI